MYAVIATAADTNDLLGRQILVEEGQEIMVDLRDGVEKGQTIEFDRVLLVGGLPDGVKVGQPTIAGAKVVAEVIDEEIRLKKIVIRQYKKRKNWRRHKGHRQSMTVIKISQIVA